MTEPELPVLESVKKFKIPILKMNQPMGEFYIGKLSAADIVAISWYDIRHLETNEIDEYLGIQRELSQSRVKEISEYIHTIDATFPTGIILAIDDRCAKIEFPEFDAEDPKTELGLLHLNNIPGPRSDPDTVLVGNIAKVIDGQHRIEAFRKRLPEVKFEVNVVFVVGADIADQASIFATVNLAQTKVNRSLVFDLFALAKTRSPEKTAHEIAVALDRSPGSPFRERIKRLGKARPDRIAETLSQATIVDMILQYISKKPALDRDQLKRGKAIGKPTSSESRELIFRTLFIEERDLDIAEIIWNYFTAVQARWPAAWNNTGTGLMLNRTNGYRALMRFLRPAYLHFTAPGKIVEMEQFLRLFEKVNVPYDHFTVENFKPGTSGETALYNLLVSATGIQNEKALL